MKQNHSQENSVKIAKILKRLHKKVVLAIITDWINVRRVTGAINTFIKFGNPRHDNYWGGEDLLSGYAKALDYIKIKEKEKDMDLRDALSRIIYDMADLEGDPKKKAKLIILKWEREIKKHFKQS